MTTLKERQRAAARARLEREMAARQANATARRKRRNTALAAAGAVIAVVAVVVILVNATGGDGKAKHTVVATATNAPAECGWVVNPALKGATGIQKNPTLVDTGVPPETTVPRNGTRDMVMNTSQGTITITLDAADAPCSAASMAFLAGKKFFDNTSCSRLTTSGLYVLQCGDPSGKGTGGPGYTFAHENLPTTQQPNYPKGVVAMAIPSDEQGNPAVDSNGSQFFIVYQDTPGQIDPSTGAFQSALGSDYSIIGTVTGGMDVVEKVAAGGAEPADKTTGNTAPKIPVHITTVTVGPIKN